jgi:hypothetical protein
MENCTTRGCNSSSASGEQEDTAVQLNGAIGSLRAQVHVIAKWVRGLPTPRRFPPPWTIEELNDACFVVSEANEQLAYVYFEEELGRRSAAKLLTKDEARGIAALWRVAH